MSSASRSRLHERAARRLSGLRSGPRRWERSVTARTTGSRSRQTADASGSTERKERDRLLLLRMVESIHRMETYLRDGRAEFMQSTLIQDAVIWNLRLVCHCAKRLSEAERERHPEINWKRMATLFRNLVRDPWHLQPEQLWECVGEELPSLKHSFQAILSNERAGR